MSIIHEALKKVQSNRSQTVLTPAQNLTKITPEARQDTAVPPAREHVPTKLPGLFKNVIVWDNILWTAMILGASVFTFINLQKFRAEVRDLTQIKSTAIDWARLSRYSPIPPLNPAPPILPAPATQIKTAKGELLLTGITFMDGKNFALINGGIYEAGEEIEGAKISHISPDRVIVIQKGKVKILKVTHP